MAPKGDFENRDRDEGGAIRGIPLAGSGLGELPEDLSMERGERETYSLQAFGSNVPDIVSGEHSRESAFHTGLGAPVADYTVRSVYDVRPPSAKDLNNGTATVGNAGCGSDTFAGFVNSLFVPRGFVAVIRAVTVYLPPTPIIAATDGTLRITGNGAVLDPENVEVGDPVGTSTPTQTAGIPFRDGEEIDTYLVVDESTLVGTLLTFTTPPAPISGGGATVTVKMRMNLLLKTGVPAMFQPANLAGKASTAVTSSVRDLEGPKSLGPSGADLMRKRRRKGPFAHVPILKKSYESNSP